jgi:hypothetical protein
MSADSLAERFPVAGTDGARLLEVYLTIDHGHLFERGLDDHIEHDIPLIVAIADRIICMADGHVIADGPPAAVRTDPVSSRLTSGATPRRSSDRTTPHLRHERGRRSGAGRPELHLFES